MFFSVLPPESMFEYQSDPRIRSIFEEPAIRKNSVNEKNESEEDSENFAIPALSTPYEPIPIPRPQRQRDESPPFSFSSEELERLREAMILLKSHGIAI